MQRAVLKCCQGAAESTSARPVAQLAHRRHQSKGQWSQIRGHSSSEVGHLQQQRCNKNPVGLHDAAKLLKRLKLASLLFASCFCLFDIPRPSGLVFPSGKSLAVPWLLPRKPLAGLPFPSARAQALQDTARRPQPSHPRLPDIFHGSYATKGKGQSDNM